MKIAFIGHLSVDINVVRGEPHTLAGGGVLHGSITAQRLGAESVVYTKCTEESRPLFGEIGSAGVSAIFLPTGTNTSIRNDYPTDNPDDRTSRLLSRGDPFRAEEIETIRADVVHVNPLWLGEFPPELIPVVRRTAPFLGGDAQGFLRRVLPDGRMAHVDWREKEQYLPFFDLFKVDIKEAHVLTGLDEPRAAARRIHDMGVKTVLLTHQGGVCVCDGECHESRFTGFTLEGRTGRGDTCTAAFLVARSRMSAADATAFAAAITSEKMQYRGAYRPRTG